MHLLVVMVLVLLCIVLVLKLWHRADERSAAEAWTKLARRAPSAPMSFDPSMVNGLPEPARRYFLFTIAPGAPLRSVAEIATHGEIGLGTRDAPHYVRMRAKQILAPPHGLVWSVDAGNRWMSISGSDGFDAERSWVRFWLMKTIPIVRAGGSRDHARAAFGRVVAEAAFWAPAALLPAAGATWEGVSRDVARATVGYHGLVQTVDVTVAQDGRPTMVVIARWSDANPDRTYRLQPFGGYLSEFRNFDGYCLPTRVEGGNFIGTDDYFPFYKARVDRLRFLVAD